MVFRRNKLRYSADDELIEENWVTRDEEMKEIEKVMDRVAQGFSKDFRVEMKEGREIYREAQTLWVSHFDQRPCDHSWVEGD